MFVLVYLFRRFSPSQSDNNIGFANPPPYPDDHGVSEVPRASQPLLNTKQPEKVPVDKKPPRLETVVTLIDIFIASGGDMSYEFGRTEKID